jgi:hypothetical protein
MSKDEENCEILTGLVLFLIFVVLVVIYQKYFA